MREVTFLQSNTEKWQEFEQLLTDETRSFQSDRLSDLFVQLTDDLSYAQTYYPNSKTTQYLNGLAATVHQKIYKNKREPLTRFITFWTQEIPKVMYEARVELFVAFIVFAGSMLIGILSSQINPEFSRIVLGDGYVNMTEENIKNGDPLAVYKKAHQMDMFTSIAINNIRVSFYTFVLGVFCSIGTLYLLFQNGVMLGTFMHFFHIHNILWKATLVIWLHGTLEISAIIIAGAAGIVLGNSIMFPKTYTRRVSFLMGAKRSLKIIIGLVPIFIIAAFIESFLTRYTEMPTALSLIIILGSLFFVIWYYVLYPRFLSLQRFVT